MSVHSSNPGHTSGTESLHSASGEAPVPFMTLVKNHIIKMAHLKDIEKTMAIQDGSSLALDKFVQDYLNSLPADYKPDYTYLLKNTVPNITKYGDSEDALYAPINSLLNLISNRFYSKYPFLVRIAS